MCIRDSTQCIHGYPGGDLLDHCIDYQRWIGRLHRKKDKRKQMCIRDSISTIKKRGTCTPASLAKLAKALEVDPADLIEEVKE